MSRASWTSNVPFATVSTRVGSGEDVLLRVDLNRQRRSASGCAPDVNDLPQYFPIHGVVVATSQAGLGNVALVDGRSQSRSLLSVGRGAVRQRRTMTTQHDLTPMRVDLTPFIRKSPQTAVLEVPEAQRGRGDDASSGGGGGSHSRAGNDGGGQRASVAGV